MDPEGIMLQNKSGRQKTKLHSFALHVESEKYRNKKEKVLAKKQQTKTIKQNIWLRRNWERL